MSSFFEVTIRPEEPGDFGAISQVVAAAFGHDVEAQLVHRIRASAEYLPSLALVAEHEARVVGHVMISKAVLAYETGERPLVMLSPLAVDPAFQRRGVGAKLVAAVTELAGEMGEPFVVLEGSPVYYGRLGFEPASRYGITLPIPSWAPQEAAQLLRLDRFDQSDPTLKGNVVYPAAFDGLD